jgi:myosin heavy subunit
MAEAAKPKKGGIKVGQKVWVADAAIAGSDLFTKADVLAIDEKGKVTVETSNDTKTQELVLPQEECHQPHPGDDVPDHCQLMYLSQPTLLENTRVRYMDDKIYTYVGSILVAVNPFRFIEGLYTQEMMAQCRGKKLWNAGCGPHVYAISEQARDNGPRTARTLPRSLRRACSAGVDAALTPSRGALHEEPLR